MANFPRDVVDTLQANPELVVAAVRDHHEDGDVVGYEVHSYPATPLYTADELNGFMRGLLPSEVYRTDPEFRVVGSSLELGKLRILFKVGGVATARAFRPRGDFTWVRLYPDEFHTAASLSVPQINRYSIPMDNGALVVPELRK